MELDQACFLDICHLHSFKDLRKLKNTVYNQHTLMGQDRHRGLLEVPNMSLPFQHYNNRAIGMIGHTFPTK